MSEVVRHAEKLRVLIVEDETIIGIGLRGQLTKLGHKVRVGYHDQGLQSLDPGTTVVRSVWPEDDPEWVEAGVRAAPMDDDRVHLL